MPGFSCEHKDTGTVLGWDADDGRAGALQGWSSFSTTFITLCVSLQFAMAHTKSQPCIIYEK